MIELSKPIIIAAANRSNVDGLLVVGARHFDSLGEEEIKSVIENTRYPNHCMSPSVKRIESKTVDWSDDHPLNMRDKQDAAYKELFNT